MIVRDNQYWYEKDLNYGRLTEHWTSKGKKQLKTQLENLPLPDIVTIHNKLGLPHPQSEEKTNYLNAILESQGAAQLFLLYEFLEKYQKTVIEYINHFEGDAEKKVLTRLFLLYLDSVNDHLLNISVYHNWNAASTGVVFKSKQPLPKDLNQKFASDSEYFAKKLSSRERRKVRFIGSYDSVFVFDKQVDDTLLQTTSGHKRVKPSKYLLVKIQPELIEVREVKGRSKFVAQNMRRLLENKYAIELIDEEQIPTKGNLETFLNRIKSNQSTSDEFKIISLKVKHSRLDKGVPVEVNNFGGGSDITRAINELIEMNAIELNNLTDVDKFTVSFSKTKNGGKRKTIIVKENNDGTITLSLNNKELKDLERQEFSKLFAQRFGIELNFPLDPTHLAANQKHVMEYLLSEEVVTNPRKFQNDAIKYLEDAGILSVKKQFRLKCTNHNCGHKMYSAHESDQCCDCGSVARKVEEAVGLEVSNNGTRTYVRSLVSKSTGLKIKTWRNIQIKNTRFSFLEVELDNKPIFLYINFKRISNSFLDYLVRSALPILFVNISRVVNASTISQQLFEQIGISETLIDENNGLKQIEGKIAELRKYALDRYSNAARSSYESMKQKIQQPESYAPKEFETDSFNMLKQLFPSAYKAGGKYAPEGFVGLEYTTDKNHKRVFEWDCKLAMSGAYSLKQAEIDQAWRYIRATLKSEELKNFNKRVNHYVIISNSIDQTTFKNFSESLKRKRLWGIGEKSVVLLNADALLELHNQFAQYQNDIFRRQNTFYEEFFKLLLNVDPTLGYCSIKKQDVIGLFQSVVSKPLEHAELNGANVEAHLIKDED